MATELNGDSDPQASPDSENEKKGRDRDGKRDKDLEKDKENDKSRGKSRAESKQKSPKRKAPKEEVGPVQTFWQERLNVSRVLRKTGGSSVFVYFVKETWGQ